MSNDPELGYFGVRGTLSIAPEGYGLLRDMTPEIYVTRSMIERHALQAGDVLTGLARPPKESERYSGLLTIETVNGNDARA